jgi:hypothetical protein
VPIDVDVNIVEGDGLPQGCAALEFDVGVVDAVSVTSTSTPAPPKGSYSYFVKVEKVSLGR